MYLYYTSFFPYILVYIGIPILGFILILFALHFLNDENKTEDKTENSDS